MSTKTPTKQRSANKKTPSKSTAKKQQTKPILSNSKQIPKSNKKNPNLINDIKQKFLSSSLKQTTYTSKDLQSKIKQILTVQGVEQALQQLTSLINNHNLLQETISNTLNKLTGQDTNGLIYLIEQYENKTQKISSYNLSVWLNAIFNTQPDIILYNEKIKHIVSQMNVKLNKNNQIPILKGKISLLAGY